MWRLALALSTLCACGDAPSFHWEGEAGTPVVARFDRWVPSVEVEVVGVGGGWFLVDTGAPFTVLDTSELPVAEGVHEVELGAFGLRLTDYEVAAFDALPFAMGDEPLVGILGGDLLTELALGLDYAAGRAWLDDAPAGEAPVAVELELAGGGRYDVPGGSLDLPATRVVARARVEGVDTWALIDTGASATVLSAGLVDRLGDGGRPRLAGVTVGTAGGTVSAYLTRVWSLGLADPAAQRPSAHVLVLPAAADAELFGAIAAEVDRDVEVVVGGSYLRYFSVTVDGPGRALAVAPYLDLSHLDANEYRRPGFTLARAGGRWTVGDVYDGTDAEAAGIVPGDTVAELGGDDLSAVTTDDDLVTILNRYDVGERVPVGVVRGGEVVTIDVLVEDLLPAYEEPRP